MSGRSNHTSPMSDEWYMPEDYYVGGLPYASNVSPNSNRIFPQYSPLQPISEPGWSSPERVVPWPSGFSGYPAPVPPFFLLDEAVPRPRMMIHHFSAPRPASQFSVPNFSEQQNSRLTADEQQVALKKLRKETYNPSPKMFSRRVSLYYRDQNSQRTGHGNRDDDDGSKRCTVCLEDFEPKEEVVITPCNHMFHESCIIPWVKEHGRCPVCRFALFEREITRNPASSPPVFQRWEALFYVPPRFP